MEVTVEQSTIDVSDGALVDALRRAYEARLAALVGDDPDSLNRASHDVEDLELRWLEHRELRRLARSTVPDTTYYLG
jgi:hypothetical protein